MNTQNFKTSLVVLLFASLAVITGCEKQGPAEKAGEEIDRALDDAGDAMNDAADDVKDATEDAAEEIEDATE